MTSLHNKQRITAAAEAVTVHVSWNHLSGRYLPCHWRGAGGNLSTVTSSVNLLSSVWFLQHIQWLGKQSHLKQWNNLRNILCMYEVSIHEKIWWLNVHYLSVTLLISSLIYMVGFTSCTSVSLQSDNGRYTGTRWHALKTVNSIGLKTIPKNFRRWSCLHLQVKHRRGKLTLVSPSERTSPPFDSAHLLFIFSV
jgi:hypothetical protein